MIGRDLWFGGLQSLAEFVVKDEVDFDVRWDEGTCVRARKFATPPLVRRELGVLGRPYQGESISGDHASWEWRDDTLVLGAEPLIGMFVNDAQVITPGTTLAAIRASA